MENPMTWGKAERVVQEAHRKWVDGRNRGVIGLSLTRTITDALRAEGLIDETAEAEQSASAEEDKKKLVPRPEPPSFA